MPPKLNLPKEATFKGPALTWKRVLAFVFDLLLLDFIIGYPFRKVMLRILPSGDFFNTYEYLSSHTRLTALISMLVVLFGLLALLYFALLEYKIGQTPGKMLLNIKVESGDNNLTFLACLIRSMYLIFVFPFVLLWIVDPVFVMFSKDKRRLSEILSRTRTVEVFALR